jgi:hypothetical protein
MANIIDQYNGDPTYTQLHVLTRNRPLAREMLKTAAFVNKQAEIEALPSRAFAWEEERRFPTHTKEDTIASILYRSKLGAAVPEHVDLKLSKAAEIFGLEEHIFASAKVATAATATEYALAEDQRLPLDNAAQIKVAEHVLHRDYTKLPLEKRADAFSRLVLAAKKHEVELNPFTMKMAGLTMSSTATLRNWLEARAAATNGKVAAAFDKMASALKSAPPYIADRNTLVKLATTIQELDVKAGLTKHYDRKLPDPLQTVFNTEKLAEEMCDLGGMQVPCSALMNLPPDVWQQIDMPEIAQVAEAGDAAAFKQIFDTIPLDVKMILREQMG